MAAMTGATVLVAAALASGAPLAPSTSLDPGSPRFADRVTATATVVVEGLDPGSVRTVGGFGPLDVLSGPTVERHDRGDGRTAVELSWVVACLNEDCVPGGDGPRRIALPPLRVSATRDDGTTARAVVRWPPFQIEGRVSRAEAGAATPPLRRETALPPPSYRVAPGTLATAFDVLAAVLLAGAVLLGIRALMRRRRRREEERLAALSPLERALLYARESEGRGSDDRRRALGLLGRILGSASALGGSASRLAWSPPEPSPDQVETVVHDVEQDATP